ncbi:MAG TPA: hypothetical protein PL110_20705 [Candidatus Eremiobacteraeota bacterium]|nr:hypothetical protein [Candidatus Eremiobacteraeota bacterium]
MDGIGRTPFYATGMTGMTGASFTAGVNMTAGVQIPGMPQAPMAGMGRWEMVGGASWAMYGGFFEGQTGIFQQMGFDTGLDGALMGLPMYNQAIEMSIVNSVQQSLRQNYMNMMMQTQMSMMMDRLNFLEAMLRMNTAGTEKYMELLQKMMEQKIGFEQQTESEPEIEEPPYEAPAISSTQQTSGVQGKLMIRDNTIYTPGGYKITYDDSHGRFGGHNVTIKGMSDEGTTGGTSIHFDKLGSKPFIVDAGTVRNIDHKNQYDFKSWQSKDNSTTFNLPDGTKITVRGDSSSPGRFVMNSVDVYYGNDHIHAEGGGAFSKNINDGYAADAMQDDGTSVYAKNNDAGKWYKPDGSEISIYTGI